MLRIWTLLAALVVCSGSLFGQDSRVEVFGGYSYLSLDVNDLGSRQSANGWTAAVSVNAYRRFAIEGDVSGNYKNYNIPGLFNVGVHDYAFLGGPRVNFKPFFVHGLVGMDRLTGTALGFSVSQNSFAGAFGAGLEWKIAQHWYAQGSGDYVLTRHNIFAILGSGNRLNQNNVRVGAGIVYAFGRMGQQAAPRRERERPSGSVPIPALGIASSTDDHGVLVADVTGGGLAAMAGLRVGDVITAVNGHPIKTAAELTAALQPGQAKLTYLVHGTWQAEAVVTIGGQP